jgi:4-hydroxyphenylacetate 3-monooxygenase
MIGTGEQYGESIRDGREANIDSGKVSDVPSHLMFKPLLDKAHLPIESKLRST